MESVESFFGATQRETLLACAAAANRNMITFTFDLLEFQVQPIEEDSTYYDLNPRGLGIFSSMIGKIGGRAIMLIMIHTFDYGFIF